MEKILPFWIIVAPVLYAVADYVLSSKNTALGGQQRAGVAQPGARR